MRLERCGRLIAMSALCLSLNGTEVASDTSNNNQPKPANSAAAVIPTVSLPDRKVIFVHGLRGSPESCWLKPIPDMLKNDSIEYSIPQLPDGDEISADAWVSTIKGENKNPFQRTDLVCYSLGTRACLLYLSEDRPRNIGSVVLVAPLSNSTDNQNRHGGLIRSFFRYKIDIESIKFIPRKWVIIHSLNDPVVPFDNAQKLAQELGAEAKFEVFADKGHFTDPQDAKSIVDYVR